MGEDVRSRWGRCMCGVSTFLFDYLERLGTRLRPTVRGASTGTCPTQHRTG